MRHSSHAGSVCLSGLAASVLSLLILLLPVRTAMAAGGAKLSPGAQYVAMGSSSPRVLAFSHKNPGWICGRSLLDYPHLVRPKCTYSSMT